MNRQASKTLTTGCYFTGRDTGLVLNSGHTCSVRRSPKKRLQAGPSGGQRPRANHDSVLGVRFALNPRVLVDLGKQPELGVGDHELDIDHAPIEVRDDFRVESLDVCVLLHAHTQGTRMLPSQCRAPLFVDPVHLVQDEERGDLRRTDLVQHLACHLEMRVHLGVRRICND